MELKNDQLRQLPLTGPVRGENPPMINREQPKLNLEEDERELNVLLEKLGESVNIKKRREYDSYYSTYHIKKTSESKKRGEGQVTTKEKIQIAKFVLGGQDPNAKPEILFTEAERRAKRTETRAQLWRSRADIDG